MQPTAECDVNDPLTCNKDLLEVCTFVNSTYKCLCPKDVSRLPDGRCKGEEIFFNFFNILVVSNMKIFSNKRVSGRSFKRLR